MEHPVLLCHFGKSFFIHLGDSFLLKVNKVFFQYSDARQRKGLLMAPLFARGWSFMTSHHVMPRGVCLLFSRQCSQHCLFIYLLDYALPPTEIFMYRKFVMLGTFAISYFW